MEIQQIFSEQISITQDFLLDKVSESYKNGSMSNHNSRLVNEGLVAIDKILNCDFLQPHDRILLEKTYRHGSDAVHERLNYFSNYYYSYQNVSKGDINAQQTAFIQINADTATMLTTILGFHRHICGIGGSTDNYYVERMPRVLWALEYVLKKQLTEIYLPTLYVLINLSQSLTEYLFSTDNQYKDSAINLLSETVNILDKFTKSKEGNEILTLNTQINLFLKVQRNRINDALGLKNKIETTELDKLPDTKTEHKLRILSSLFHLDKVQFIKLFESELASITDDVYRSRPGLNNFLFLQCLSYYCLLKPFAEGLELNLNPLSNGSIDLIGNLKNIFNNYENSHGEVISEADISLLLSYNDEALRTKLANTIIGVDKGVLERERQKPHGVFEIADMELRIRLNQETYFLCMPFKSGIEIKSQTVPESISYQIFRPFIHLDKTIVIFVTAKRCSQNLMNYIKRMQDKLGWGIAILENEELAKLLKVNGQLN